MPYEQQRYVVAVSRDRRLLGAFDDPVGEHVQRPIFRFGELLGQGVNGLPQVGAGPFHQAVCVEGQQGTGRQGQLDGLKAGLLVHAQQQSGWQVEHLRVVRTVTHDRRRVACRGQQDALPGHVDVRIEATAKQLAVELQ